MAKACSVHNSIYIKGVSLLYASTFRLPLHKFLNDKPLAANASQPVSIKSLYRFASFITWRLRPHTEDIMRVYGLSYPLS